MFCAYQVSVYRTIGPLVLIVLVYPRKPSKNKNLDYDNRSASFFQHSIKKGDTLNAQKYEI